MLEILYFRIAKLYETGIHLEHLVNEYVSDFPNNLYKQDLSL
jgi:hypothetical protein